MRLYICGQKHFGAEVFASLRNSHIIVGVSAPPFASAETTTGEKLPDRLRAAAERHGVPWLAAGHLRAELVTRLGVDLIVAAHSHDFIGRATREAARYGALGYHPSLLPLHRGRDAVRWTVKMGDRVTGGSVYWLDQNVDGGPLAAQRHILVHPGDDAEALWQERLAPLGVRMLGDVIGRLEKTGQVVAIPQAEECATWEPSWTRPPIFRPELPRLGGAEGVTYITHED